jgi:hypothetical protein
VFPVRYEQKLYVMLKKGDRLCGLVVRVPGSRTEMYCVSCEARTEFVYLCDLMIRFPGYRSKGPSSIPVGTRFSEK